MCSPTSCIKKTSILCRVGTAGSKTQICLQGNHINYTGTLINQFSFAVWPILPVPLYQIMLYIFHIWSHTSRTFKSHLYTYLSSNCLLSTGEPGACNNDHLSPINAIPTLHSIPPTTPLHFRVHRLTMPFHCKAGFLWISLRRKQPCNPLSLLFLCIPTHNCALQLFKAFHLDISH